jgi:uncharacterized protein (TIGR00730 family)
MSPEKSEIDRLAETLPQLIAGPNRDLKLNLVRELCNVLEAPLGRLDLKMISSAARELRQAFTVFGPHRKKRKTTIFGSARVPDTDPGYLLAFELAKGLADHGWMVITGGGPGIMDAGIRGAGQESSFGINIRLPFEQAASEALENSDHLIEMKYFFTRKVLMIKESDAFVSLPGGLGTLDETFELLTLMQTGKAQLAPVVLLDPPGSGYWNAFEEFLERETVSRGLVDPIDLRLYRKVTSAVNALDEILGFYRNYDSMRMVRDRLIIRMRKLPEKSDLVALQSEFGDIAVDGAITPIATTPWELRENDKVDLPRLAIRFDNRSFGRLRLFIDALNRV